MKKSILFGLLLALVVNVVKPHTHKPVRSESETKVSEHSHNKHCHHMADDCSIFHSLSRNYFFYSSLYSILQENQQQYSARINAIAFLSHLLIAIKERAPPLKSTII